MELKIGENIKRLRYNKGMTQEQLAELLNISCAAVSKWESCSTYPDVTMIMPLARVFDVSIDELMGYDSARAEADIEAVIAEYQKLHLYGNFQEASEIIREARKTYPNDYRIMNCYMQDIAGGISDNNFEILNKHHNEFIQICNCILDGCTDEPLRLDAMVMKAKLVHAAGNAKEALEILMKLPSWGQSAEIKIEQLFSKDSAEYHYWTRRNLYGLSDIMASKMIRSIWYEEGITMEERILRCETIGDMFTKLRTQTREPAFTIFEHMIFAELSSNLIFSCGNIEDIIRICEKRLIAAREITKAARNDSILQELLIQTYKTDNMLHWTSNWLKTASHKPLVQLRNNTDYMEMLMKVEE